MVFVDPRDPILAAIRRLAKSSGPRYDPKLSPVIQPVIVVPSPGLQDQGPEPGVTNPTEIPAGVIGTKIPLFWVPMGDDGALVTLAAGNIRTDRFEVSAGSGTEYLLDWLIVLLTTGVTQASSSAGDLQLAILPYGGVAANQAWSSNRFVVSERIIATSTRLAFFFVAEHFALAGDWTAGFRWVENQTRALFQTSIPRIRLFTVPGQAGGRFDVVFTNNTGNSTWTQMGIFAKLTAMAAGVPE